MSNIHEYDLDQCNINLKYALDDYKAIRARLLKIMDRQKELMTKPPHIEDSVDEPPKTGT